MINLIPKEEKKKIARNFYFKLVILFVTMLGAIFLIALFSILPSYFLSTVKNNIIDAKLAAQKSEPVPIPDQQTMGIIKDLNSKISVVENAEKNQFSISNNVINDIILKKISGIKITDIAYSNDSLKGKTIKIQGTAPSREVLLLFRQALEEDALFKRVDLPVSNFVKGSNIQFYLTLIPG
jgi:cell division protein FtsI/penicillin-binding protein 2